MIFKFYYNDKKIIVKLILIALSFTFILFGVKFFYDDFFSNIILLNKKVFIILIFVSGALVFLRFLKCMDIEKRNLFKEKINIDIGKFLSFEIILIFLIATFFQIYVIWNPSFLLNILNK